MAGITLRCPNSHAFVTQAKPGNTVSCPACRSEGRGRVSCRVPKRPAEPDGRQAPADSDAARLAAAWALETPPIDGPGLGAEAGQPCEHCGGPMRWTAAHTAVMCPACPAWSVSQNAQSRAAVHGQAVARREARSRGELVVRTEADDDAERAARINLHTRREAVGLLVDQLETVADPAAYDLGAYQQMAFEIGAVLRGYRPEIGRTDDSALARITREIVAIRDSDQFRDLADEAEQVAERRQRRQYAIEQAAAAEARELEAQRQAAAAEREAERQRQARARHDAAVRPTQVNGYVELAKLLGRRQVAMGQAVAAKGACGFTHPVAVAGTVPAKRLYGIETTDWSGQGSGYQMPGTPEIRACGKHFKAADDEIERASQEHFQGPCPPGVKTCYWELG